MFIVHDFYRYIGGKTMKPLYIHIEGFQANKMHWMAREAWTSITIPYVNNLCLSTIRRQNEHKNDLHLKCFVIDYLHISYMSWMCYNNKWNLQLRHKFIGIFAKSIKQAIFPWIHNVCLQFFFSVFSFFLLFLLLVSEQLHSTHTHITSIDSRKPSAINYVKNVCQRKWEKLAHSYTTHSLGRYIILD